MFADEILEALADDAFRSLTNNGDGWTIAYAFDELEEEGTMTNSHMDSLVSDFIEYLQVMRKTHPRQRAKRLLKLIENGVDPETAIAKVSAK